MQLCFAPMDGITTCATRLISQEVFEQYGNKSDSFQLWTEFMNVDGFLINPRKVIKHLLTTSDQKPIAQIYGGKVETLLQAAQQIDQEYYQVFAGIELNTGCPSTTVMKVWGGSDMMKDKEKTLHTIQQLSKVLTFLPFSLKTRAGIKEEDKSDQLDFIVQASQFCNKITIHGRTLKQLYIWEADREFIQEVKKQVLKNGNPNCEIIGNGGISSYEQAKKYCEQYGVDGVMIGQWAIGDPWIFTPHQASMEEKLTIILRHLDITVACDQYFEENIEACEEKINGKITIPDGWVEERIKRNLHISDFESRSVVEFRKFLFQYIKGIPESRERKQRIVPIKHYLETRILIQKFFEEKNI